MHDFTQWLESLKLTNAEVKNSVEKLEKCFTSEGFDVQMFEGMLNKGIVSIETSVTKTMNTTTNANS